MIVMIVRFQTSVNSLRAKYMNKKNDLVERKQMPGESIDNFFYSLNVLRSKLTYQVSEGETIKLAVGSCVQDQ